MKVRNNRCISVFETVLVHVCPCFYVTRTSLKLQTSLSLFYFSKFELPNWECGLSAVAVYTGTFTMLVIKLKSCARCAGFELDLRTEKNRSQNFF